MLTSRELRVLRRRAVNDAEVYWRRLRDGLETTRDAFLLGLGRSVGADALDAPARQTRVLVAGMPAVKRLTRKLKGYGRRDGTRIRGHQRLAADGLKSAKLRAFLAQYRGVASGFDRTGAPSKRNEQEARNLLVFGKRVEDYVQPIFTELARNLRARIVHELNQPVTVRQALDAIDAAVRRQFRTALRRLRDVFHTELIAVTDFATTVAVGE